MVSIGMHRLRDWSWCAQVRRLVMVCTGQEIGHGVHRLGDWSWCAQVKRLVMVCTG